MITLFKKSKWILFKNFVFKFKRVKWVFPNKEKYIFSTRILKQVLSVLGVI